MITTVLIPLDDFWIAQCLEVNINITSFDLPKLIEAIQDTVSGIIEEDAWDAFGSTPDKYFKIAEEAEFFCDLELTGGHEGTVVLYTEK